MITKQQIELWIDEGFHILQDGKPVKVDGNIWDYISSLDATHNNVLVLREVINWEEEEIAKI
ncbi:hypothetical protein [Sphingobacterium rhinopitheci]|uniref:hypothetical protein n=1 Tax=Sphingobacterium rhinopitheci TaxID=2781960 RepID=UPI001F51E65F|nr:hypothetical protein [Sphingobacterium rhinopitheci]MCI0921054.1 hypothetical protein [Sphingobacterium rhinopitheci]